MFKQFFIHFYICLLLEAEKYNKMLQVVESKHNEIFSCVLTLLPAPAYCI